MKMKNYTLFFVFGIAFMTNTQAQSFENIDWQGKKVPAMTIDVYQNSQVTEEAIKELFEKMGYYAKVSKGIFSYKSIKIKDIDNEPYDVLVKVERKNKQEKDASVVYMAMAKDYDNYVKHSSDKHLISDMKSFMSTFQTSANEKALLLAVKEQEGKAKNAEKKLSTLKEEKTNIENKIKKLEERKLENIKEIEKQEQEVENQNKALKLLMDRKNQ
jgi:hypothetical protein